MSLCLLGLSQLVLNNNNNNNNRPIFRRHNKRMRIPFDDNRDDYILIYTLHNAIV